LTAGTGASSTGVTKVSNIIGNVIIAQNTKLLYQVIGTSGYVYVKPVVKFSGIMTTVDATKEGLVINGTTYYISKTVGSTASFSNIASSNSFFGKVITYYTDGKYIVAATDESTGTTTTPTNYSYAGVVDVTFSGHEGSIWNSSDATAKIALSLTTGATSILNINSFTIGNVTYTFTKTLTAGSDFATNLTALKGKFVYYALRSDGSVDVYVLTAGAANTASTKLNIAYTAGAAALTGTTTFIGDNTTFFVYDTTAKTFTRYTGRSKIPTIVADDSANDIVIYGKMFVDNDMVQVAFISRPTDKIVTTSAPVVSGNAGLVISTPVVSNDGSGFYQKFTVWTAAGTTTITCAAGVGLTGYTSNVKLYDQVSYTLTDGKATQIETGAAAYGTFTQNTAGTFVGYIENVGSDFVMFSDGTSTYIVSIESGAKYYQFTSGVSFATSLKVAKAESEKAVIINTNATGKITGIYYLDVAKTAVSAL